MDIDDICKYIGYIVVAFIVLYFAAKSINFQIKCVEGFVKKKPTAEGFVKKKPTAEGFVNKKNPNENKTA